MWSDCLLILLMSTCAASLSEGLSWLLIYRTSKYKQLKLDIERQSKKLEKMKESQLEMSIGRQYKKKIERDEERLKSNNKDLSLVKMKSMCAIGLVFTALLSVLNNFFSGKVVAHLPFVPFPWIRRLSHRNLNGSDYTECSFIFLYVLCIMFIRQNIQKVLGFAPSRSIAASQKLF